MSKLMEYFNEVDKDAVMRLAHQINPIGSMRNFGLSSSACDAITSGDIQKLANAIGIAVGEFSQLQVIHVPQTVSDLNQ